MSKKTCIQCKKSFPDTAEFFHKSKDGLHSRCKQCRIEHERERRSRKRSERLEAIEVGGVDLFINQARLGGSNIPHSSELLEVVMEYFGGVRGFANAFMKHFYDAPPGGAFRTKMLDSVVRLASNNTAMGGAKKPLTLWSEEELEEELDRRLKEAVITINAQAVSNMPALEAKRPGGGMPSLPAKHPEPERADAVPADDGEDAVRGVE